MEAEMQNKKINIRLGGSVDNSFGKSTSLVTKNLDRLGRKEVELKNSQALIGKLKADQIAVGKTSAKIKEQTDKLKSLQKEYGAASKPSKTLQTRISKLQKTIGLTNDELAGKRKNLKQSGSALKRLGIDTANLTSEEKRLQRALEKTQRQARLKTKTMNLMGGSLRSLKYGALGAAAAAGALGASSFKGVSGFAQHADNVGKTADKLGVSTDKLQQLRYAGERTGVSIKTLDMALQRMGRRVAEAAKGTGEARNAIAELGLSAIELNELAPDKALGLVADKLELVGNQKDRMRLAMKLFDSEGVAMVNTMRGGSKALKNYGKEAEKVGYILSEKSIRAAEKNRDAYLDMSTSMGAMKYQLANEFMPTFTRLFVNITKWVAENKQHFEGWGKNIGVIISSTAAVFSGLGTVISTVFGTAWRFGEWLGGALFETVQGVKKLFNDFKSVGQSISDFFTGVIDKIFSSVDTVFKKVDAVREKLADFYGWIAGKEEIKLTAEQQKQKGVDRKMVDSIPAGRHFNAYQKARESFANTSNNTSNNVTIHNNVTVQGNGDEEAISRGIELGTQRALFDYNLGGI
jgi:hypothetical protein